MKKKVAQLHHCKPSPIYNAQSGLGIRQGFLLRFNSYCAMRLLKVFKIK